MLADEANPFMGGLQNALVLAIAPAINNAIGGIPAAVNASVNAAVPGAVKAAIGSVQDALELLTSQVANSLYLVPAGFKCGVVCCAAKLSTESTQNGETGVFCVRRFYYGRLNG
ncbi:hypothetical protein B0H13DRAFT_1863929 [Mycena leptocephala]|nr:hypothetical protein B0H13DRAFT_1863929 [Mycena leptocephala]